MLRRLYVENYALIDKLEMELDAHLNIITGETGAGKSILLGALGLLLGAKNEGSAMKDNTRNCTVEGNFCLAGHGMESFFAENDLDYADETTLTRIITPAGKSRAFINDVPIQLTQLRDFGAQLIDIHSQHENLILSSEEFRMHALDTVAGNGALLAEYAVQYSALADLRRELTALREAAESGRRDQEWLSYQVEELTAANLRAGEQQELESEQAVLSNADQIGEVLMGIRNDLDDDQLGILLRLKAAENGLLRLRESYPQAEEFSARIRSVLLELKDISISIASDSESIESDPERLQRVNDRLDTIYSLCQKHHVEDLSELIAVRERYDAQLGAIVQGDEQIEALEAKIAVVMAKAQELVDKLRKSRTKSAPAFSKTIVSTLVRLGMPDTIFTVELQPSQSLTRTGGDNIRFLFTANRTAAPQPIERIASGGELSRVMLAIKALLASSMQLPTIIFDEIDTGVSGRIADVMGEIIRTLATTMQVVSITHLPQVASKGSTHFVVYKEQGRTAITRLTATERVEEIAKMLSGSEVTAAAVEQAKILLTN